MLKYRYSVLVHILSRNGQIITDAEVIEVRKIKLPKPEKSKVTLIWLKSLQAVSKGIQ